MTVVRVEAYLENVMRTMRVFMIDHWSGRPSRFF